MSAPATARCYYSTNSYPTHYIDMPITRWDTDNWTTTFETFLTSSQRDTLAKHIVPGAFRKLHSILGLPKYIDSTFYSGNTLILEPIHGYGLSSNVREGVDIAVRNYQDWVIPHTSYFGCKLECVRLDIE